ncbi:MAG TPA: Ldh family oxidoreductase [Armatimonadetes bacterium]|nr:Ldh family oxidoreductase [Armatimonadota bacterium]
MPTFTASELQAFVTDLFRAAGVPEEEARIVADALVTANLVGQDSHGVIRIPQYLQLLRRGQIRPGAPLEVVREAETTAVLDGHWGFGQVQARRATQMALAKARTYGLGAVGLHHCNHVGRLADYVLLAVEQGCVGLCMVNNHGAGRNTAPFGGTQRRLSTNPIAFAAPTAQGEPLLVDITTSVTAEGKIRVRRNRGQRVPEGWLLDGYGRPTTDPQALYREPRGALLPLGGEVGYKGFGLSLMVEVLAGALSGAGCSREEATVVGNGFFLLALDISRFAPVDEVARQLSELIAYVKSSPTQPGFTEILVPGEPEARTAARRRAEGIPIDEETWRQVLEAAQPLLPLPSLEVRGGK